MRYFASTVALLLGAVAFAADPPPPAYQPARYDLSAHPPYVKSQRVTGILRIYGTPLEELVGKLAGAFRSFHGQVRLNAYLINTSQAFAGLVTGQADIGLMGHRQWRNGFVAFEKQFGYAPLEIRFASGSYDDPLGTTPGLMFIVNKRNPLAGLTLAQIDGIYGAQRSGGWKGTKWSADAARGPEKNIRTWGQLGLTGEWGGPADPPPGLRRHSQQLGRPDRARSIPGRHQMEPRARGGSTRRHRHEGQGQDP